MIRTDETALICDLAETYGVLDWRALPLDTVAALSSGLRDNSRIKMKLSGQNVTPELLLLASAVDRLAWLVWAKTRDGQNGTNRPESIAAKMLGIGKEEEQKQYRTFRSAAEFEEARRRAINREV